MSITKGQLIQFYNDRFIRAGTPSSIGITNNIEEFDITVFGRAIGGREVGTWTYKFYVDLISNDDTDPAYPEIYSETLYTRMFDRLRTLIESQKGTLFHTARIERVDLEDQYGIVVGYESTGGQNSVSNSTYYMVWIDQSNNTQFEALGDKARHQIIEFVD